MMELIFAIIAFVVLIALIVWLPFFKQSKKSENSQEHHANLRNDTNVRLYHEHKSEIEKDYAEGGIDEESYQYLLTELDNSLLQDIEANAAEVEDIRTHAPQNFSMVWPLSISVFIIAFSFFLYNKNGVYQAILHPAPIVKQPSQQEQQADARQQMMTHIKELQAILKENPDDGDAWYNLGQSLLGEGAFDGALKSFDQVIRIEGEKAEILGAKAQANYYKNEQIIDAVVQDLIDRALALDLADPSTNILLGMHNFINQNYQQAISYWQVVIESNRPSVNIQALQEAVSEATNRLAITSGADKTQNSVNNPQDKAATDSNVVGPKLTIKVSLSDEIQAKMAQGEDKVVFIYAIPTDGRRMPLAAIKIMASSLPTTIVLSDQQAMSPQANLSSTKQVHVFAIVSKLGGAGIKSGDFKAQVKDIAVSRTDTIELVVNNIVE